MASPPLRSHQNAPRTVSASEGRKLMEAERKTQKKSSQAARFRARFEEELVGLPKPVTEHVFHPTKKWRLDYAWPDLKVAVELHGGIFGKGRHVRPVPFSGDREKMVEAQLLGWVVFEITEVHLRERSVHDWIKQAIIQRSPKLSGNSAGITSSCGCSS